ncbi:RimJ/RimL family protein N-acetyltransferase [Deinococcus yavapaiensis KR-236]|uniref:RimJ/RimL family protein N-acetyltransferase n=2 Tax=Deinococcus TaxID=1298 RepID=A0A318SHE4_9DEIO|nr:RimJ/RimL family protein N-acetyltransferase [Deinococcus yavapaiensis KR-236]
MLTRMARLRIVEGDAIFLGRFVKEDVPDIARHFQNLELTAYLGSIGATYTVEEEQGWYDAESRQTAERRTFAVFEKALERLIGAVSLFDINHRHGTATLGVVIYDPEDWGRGFGSEAVRLAVAYGMFFLDLHNVMLQVFAYNERGVAAYRKVGFREIGRRTGAVVLGGQRFDQVYMEITRDSVDLTAMRALIRQLR